MIISHRHRFIFLKTRKTAGTSIETYLSAQCGDQDIVTPFGVEVAGHVARNAEGWFNPLPELVANRRQWRHVLSQWSRHRKYRNHMPGYRVRGRISRRVWDGYFKFCVERNPWDKTLSHFHMERSRVGGDLEFDDYLAAKRFCIDHPIYTEPRDPQRLLVDRVVRYESLNEELSDVFQQFGVSFDGSLGVRAKGGFRDDRRSYREVYTEAQREIVAHAYRREIALLGYTF